MGRYYPMDSDNSAVHIARKEQTMSRWIEYDDAIERLGAYLMADAQIEWGGTASENIEDWKELATDILKGSPSIDICFCKECRYCKKKRGTFKGEPITFYRCEENNRDVESDDYCSWGERRASDDKCRLHKAYVGRTII